MQTVTLSKINLNTKNILELTGEEKVLILYL